MKINSRLWVSKQNATLLGPGRVLLLEKIEEFGSISKAAKSMKMSYKAAWDSINTMNSLSSTPLVSSNSGGANGGGTTLTDEGKKAIEAYKKLEKIQSAIFENMEIENIEDILQITNKLNFQSSARNQIKAKIISVEEIEDMDMNSIANLDIGNNKTIKALVTTKSAQNFHEGMDVIALIKAGSVHLLKEALNVFDNELNGKVSNIINGKNQSEVFINVGNKTFCTLVDKKQLLKDKIELESGVNIYFLSSSIILVH